jgi:hypothetical protein
MYWPREMEQDEMTFPETVFLFKSLRNGFYLVHGSTVSTSLLLYANEDKLESHYESLTAEPVKVNDEEHG